MIFRVKITIWGYTVKTSLNSFNLNDFPFCRKCPARPGMVRNTSFLKGNSNPNRNHVRHFRCFALTLCVKQHGGGTYCTAFNSTTCSFYIVRLNMRPSTPEHSP
jgi:hypothetical protein